jgi:hypothetical protein
VAEDGGAAMFSSLTAFGDAVGTGVATDYMSIRGTDPAPGTNGWATHAITPPQEPSSINGVLALDPMYVGDLSPDLGRGVFQAWSPLTDDPNVANVQNLYVRDDLRSPGPGSYRLASACALCEVTGTPLPPHNVAVQDVMPVYGGASADFSHVVFEQQTDLTSDALPLPANCEVLDSCRSRAYESVEGQTRLVGLVPSGKAPSCGEGGPACVAAQASILGASVGATNISDTPVHVISADGSRVFFTVPTNAAGSVTTGTQTSGKVYVRTNGTSTDQLNASERTDCAGDPTCGGDGIPNPAPDTFAPARYWGAAKDGSRAFFTTTQALTDDAPLGNQKLYMYDTTKPASDPHNLTYLNASQVGGSVDEVMAVIGESDDGHYVYFIAKGQLVAGAPLLGNGEGVYLWHDGTVSYIGKTVINETSELPTGANYTLGVPQWRVTPDGRHLLLSSHNGSGFAPNYDQGSCQTSSGVGCREFYVYSADDSTPTVPDIVCASCNPSGTPATANAAAAVREGTGGATMPWHQNHPISEDGSRVFFTTAEALLPQDLNGKEDVYQYDTPTPDRPKGQLFLISTGTSTSNSMFMDASPNGSDVFFVTNQQLVGWDTDGSLDLYDARAGGGFPEPPAAPTGCGGPVCQGALAAPPAGVKIGSDSFAGVGNFPEIAEPQAKKPSKPSCRKGYVKRRVKGKRRCVKARRASKSQRRAK